MEQQQRQWNLTITVIAALPIQQPAPRALQQRVSIGKLKNQCPSPGHHGLERAMASGRRCCGRCRTDYSVAQHAARVLLRLPVRLALEPKPPNFGILGEEGDLSLIEG